MTIEKKQDGAALELSLAGRLDTLTAPELDKELRASLGGVEQLTLDFSGLEYISSAGLRVLLSAHKAMSRKNGMTLTGVTDSVKEILDVTGFTDILTIR